MHLDKLIIESYNKTHISFLHFKGKSNLIAVGFISCKFTFSLCNVDIDQGIHKGGVLCYQNDLCLLFTKTVFRHQVASDLLIDKLY